MGDVVPCFWIEPTDRVLRRLRRYVDHSGGRACAEGWHQASVPIASLGNIPVRRTLPEVGHWDPREVSGDSWPHSDPRWPVECAKGCGYRFLESDHWQLFVERAYRRSDGQGSDMVLHLHDDDGTPPGAMWDAWWMPWKGPDALSLTVQLPDGTPWCVDGPATGGGHWTRTGDPRSNPPTVTASPSIAAGKPETYHGYLRNGQLVHV